MARAGGAALCLKRRFKLRRPGALLRFSHLVAASPAREAARTKCHQARFWISPPEVLCAGAL